MTVTAAPASTRPPVHPVDEVLPAPQLAIYGIQHVLAFYAGAVIVPILLASAIKLSTPDLIHLINADLFTCGIASIIQSIGFWKVGVRLPLLQGVTFTAVAPMISIGVSHGGGVNGLLYIYGSVLIAGLFTLAIAPFFGKLIRFFPPVVTGSVITIIGLSLLPVAAGDAVMNPLTGKSEPGNGRWILYAIGTVLLIVAIQRIFRGFIATVAVLIGLIVGTAIAWSLGDAKFSDVGSSHIVGVTTPFHFGTPKFAVAAIISMIIVMLITAVETTGDVFATGEIVEKRVGGEDVTRALRADGLATVIGGVLNSFPYTCFAENVGLVRLTRIKSRYVVAAAGGFMIILGLLPKAGAVVAGIPSPVLGGAGLAMFATVAVVGIQTLTKVDFNDHRNVIIVASSLGLATFVTAQPDVAKSLPDSLQVFLGSGITIGSIAAFVLYIVFFHLGSGLGPAVAGAPGHLVRLEQVNEMTQEEFVQTFGSLFQGPSWMVERAFGQRPFSDSRDLRQAFQEALFAATSAEQVELVNAYPRLGQALGGDAPVESLEDQGTRGLTHLGEQDQSDLDELTAAYEEQFGFPLVICVRDEGSFDDLIRHGWVRMRNSSVQEHNIALVEIAKIAGYRFDRLVADANPINSARVRAY
ncbi:2-oxo-4-hydroxy-4-carboxy-5-ureidoimidazoline decarboxylase [Allobranchiibius sp. GilTou73]|uniref:2-oxo-4-hydroxy-4-carboxy-5-ureidoimidazoline decarboxylase n=1 Tax=Allobranchiibius sp. GilTou73 TaxID=2904523 RepID=UPI001F1D8944|nr:2-oxo-4-hydroxy-4-carboxy-5-ureidoimidazoline decarboxylase [Allobranchiibius sp. GilTou73]UIJ35655.1 2-oxo-4-hydroxy-4-carboxy-5-ureidoimidazoline decarboxylase [Allobranchiibius sp. GilTou73]